MGRPAEGIKPIKPKGSKVWYASGTINGVKIRRTLKTTDRAQAHRLCVEISRALEAATPDNGLLARHVIEYYRTQTGKDHGGYLEKLLLSFGGLTVDELTQERVSTYCVEVYPHTKRDHWRRAVFVPLNAAFTLAHKQGWRGLPLIKFYAPEPEAREIPNPPSDKWMSEMAEKYREDLGTLMMLLAYSGLRISEALGISAEADIKQNGDVVDITIPDTKNGKHYVVRVHPAVVPRLRKQLMSRAGLPLWPWSEEEAVNRRLRKEAERCGMVHYSTHKIGRHKFAEMFLGQGHTLLELMEAGRWESYNAVLHYKHLEQTGIRDKVTALPDIGRKTG